MEKILLAAKCLLCDQILKTPVLLPCGISVCQSHITEHQNASSEDTDGDDQFPCPSCTTSHRIPPDTGFIVNHTCEILIDTYFGEKHERAVNACHQLVTLIDEFDTLQGDVAENAFIEKSIGELRQSVLTRAELLKNEIDERASEIVRELEQYASECKSSRVEMVQINGPKSSSCKTINNNNVLKEMAVCFEERRVEVNEWLAELNGSLDVDSKSRWDAIVERCESESKELFAKVKEAKSLLLLNRFNEFRAKAGQFAQLGLFGSEEWYEKELENL